MKTLCLLRHGHAEAAFSHTLEDFDRPLSARGTVEAQQAGAFLKAHGYIPELALTSSALRTRETVQFALLGTPTRIELQRGLYLADTEALLREVTMVENTVNCLLITAHNPGIAELAYLLSDGESHEPTHGFMTGALVVFSIDCDDWSLVHSKNAKLIKTFIVD